ncbi:MAG: hypothetical protein DRZ76_01945 [Candidatus Nealsonbacteria bacterium]|nr:MAG: hypothetical protein DRZ76_01945 [Candidatus Nealsonbacteria bacterium]
MKQKHEIEDPLINENFREIFANAQDIGHRIGRSTPNIKEVREGQIVLYKDATNTRLVTKIFGNLYYINLTAL